MRGFLGVLHSIESHDTIDDVLEDGQKGVFTCDPFGWINGDPDDNQIVVQCQAGQIIWEEHDNTECFNRNLFIFSTESGLHNID